jgi:hypothetical protein
MRVRAQLESAGAIRVTKQGKLTRIVALTTPDVKLLFTSEELKVVDYWIDHIANDHTAASISEKSHDYAWEIAKMGEELPLKAIFTNRIREPTDTEMEKFRQRAKSLGLI